MDENGGIFHICILDFQSIPGDSNVNEVAAIFVEPTI